MGAELIESVRRGLAGIARATEFLYDGPVSRMPAARALVVVLAPLALLAGCGDGAAPAAPADPSLDTEERAAIVRVNEYRNGRGLEALKACAPLHAAASERSEEARDGAAAELTPRARLCEAGYPPACGDKAFVIELQAAGIDDADFAVERLAASKPDELGSTAVTVLGVGQASGPRTHWTFYLAGSGDPASPVDPSCEEP